MNKKLIMVLLALSSVTAVKAQTEKGNQLLGGSVGFTTSKGNGFNRNSTGSTSGTDDKSTSYNIGPNYSYFIGNNLDLGGSISYTYQKSTSTATNTNQFMDSKYQSATTMVYLRKYFLYENKIGIRTGPYASYTYGRQITNNSTLISNGYLGETVQENRSYGVGLGLEIVYFPVKKLGLSSAIGSLSYGHVKYKDNSYGNVSNSDSNTFGFALASTVNFSVFYVFGK